MWNNDPKNKNQTKSLELLKKKRVYANFSVKNIRFCKPYWKELIALKINQNIPFVEYIPDEHSYKTKPDYLKYIKTFLLRGLNILE